MTGALIVAGTTAIVFALIVVTAKNPFYGALALIGHLGSLAVLFLSLEAQFVAVAQVVVYAGAIVVLFLFVIAYLGLDAERLAAEQFPLQRIAAFVLCGLIGGELVYAFQATDLGLGDGAPLGLGFGTTAALGQAFVDRFLLSFETGSFVLLVASVGAIVLARRRGSDGRLTFETEAQLATASFQRRTALPAGVTVERAGVDRSERPDQPDGADARSPW